MERKQCIFLLVLISIFCLLSVSAISAAEDIGSDTISSNENQELNIEENIKEEDVSTTSNENQNQELNLKQNIEEEDVSKSNVENQSKELNLEENNNENLDVLKIGQDQSTLSETPQTINDLHTLISVDYKTNTTIFLSNNYRYNETTDGAYKSGITIKRPLTIYGNGFTIDGNHMARIFSVSSNNVTFYNINFINGNTSYGGAIYRNNGYDRFTVYNCTFSQNFASSDGGAIYQGNAYNCIFTQNRAKTNGGAIRLGDAYNCTFSQNQAKFGGAIYGGISTDCNFTQNNATNGGAIYGGTATDCSFNQNKATTGGAMYGGNAILCTFNGDTTYNTTVIPAIINVLNYTSKYQSGERLKFNLTVNGTLYNGFNTTIKIYKDGLLLKTVYGLTGEGWVVDLWPGNYTAVLSLTDYPEEESSNAIIIVKENIQTFKDLNALIKEYKTNTTIFLSNSYTYDEQLDGAYKSGITIDHALTIYGNGFTIDGNHMARIFSVSSNNVTFYNINFINGNTNYGGAIYRNNGYDRFTVYNCTFSQNFASSDGGAIYQGNAYNCIFTQNRAKTNGGAIRLGDAYNCTFSQNQAKFGGAINNGVAYNCTFSQNNATNGGAIYGGTATDCSFNQNNATTGGAMYGGNAILCTFNGDTTYNTTVIPAIINVLNYTSKYQSGERLKFNLTVNGTLYNGFNTTIKIYKDGLLLKTVYGLTGEGWVVDLDVGTYTAVLSLTDYPEEESSNAIIIVKENIQTFKDLNAFIKEYKTNTTIFLSNNYTYDEQLDGAYKSGITIDHALTICGNGFTIDGNHMARIFSVSSNNVTFYNINFINGKSNYGGAIYRYNDYDRFTVYNCTFSQNYASSDGGAIYQGNAYNCTFIQNQARGNGGAIRLGDAYNCTFSQNQAKYNGGAINNGVAYNCTFSQNNATNGGAMYDGTAILCTFNGDTIYNTTVIPAVINVLNYSSTYQSGERLKFNLTVNGTLYNGFNTTIKIYKDGLLLKTVYGLTGEGWVVDLDEGVYTAVLSLTDYPEENSVNATIIVKENAFVVIGPITNITIGQPVIINYNTNSNGTVTIKVNGTPVTDGKYTPMSEGIYNVTIEIAENEYYTAASNETTFVVEKINATIVINPITNITIGQPVLINYTTDSDGLVTIKVNGTPVTDGKFTPMFEGVYNVTVEVAETDFYTAASNETTFVVEKINATIVINPITNITIGESVLINYTTDSDGTVMIKVNGVSVSVGNFTPDKAGIYNVTVEVAETDFYTGASNETTFVVEKINATVVIDPIVNITIGQSVLINYTTNSNGTVMIKVNGVSVSVGNFTPDKAGIYNVTVEVAESDYYTGASNETSFVVEKINATIVINPITNITIGQPVLINYTTNSNGTVTIKVNGTPITDGKFTPMSEGIYNVTVEVAETDFYTGASNETSFVVEKINATIVINPITNITIGQPVLINYTTNSNGTVTIKVNGTPITDGKFTPMSEGIYNVTVEVAETDFYTGASNETSFVVEKINATIVINPITNITIGQTVLINYTTNSNGTVIIKVNGTPITGDMFTPGNAGIYNVTVEVVENDFYTGASNETSFVVEKINATIVINPITNITIGQPVLINYTTNSNGTVIIKVNGTPITGDMFTPGNAGIYNVTVEVVENDFYTGASNETSFVVEKINATVVINPIDNITVGQSVLINYTTNSNGTVMIKVNGVPVSVGNFTPDKAGIYNVTVEVAENEYYTAASNEVIFTVEKINATVVISPIDNITIGQIVLINYTTNSNGTVTIKVNGTPVSVGDFTPDKAGIYNVTVEVAENDYYTAASDEITFVVEKINATVVINHIDNITIGQSIFINYTTDSDGIVTIKVNGTPVSVGNFTPDKAGIYNVTIEVGESDLYTAASNETTFTVEKLESKIYASSVTTTYNVNKYLTITLKDVNGKAIAGSKITVNLGGAKKYTTNANGQVRINVATLVPKTYTVKISYAGDTNHKNSVASVKVKVNKAKPKITAKSTSYKLSLKTKKYTVTIKDNKNKVIKNTKVTLKVNRKTYTVKTNSKGQAIFKLNNLNKKGSYIALITFPANKYYNKVSKKVKITVKV